LRRVYGSKEIKKLTKLFKKHKESLFRFLKDLQVGWENTAAERSLGTLVMQMEKAGSFGANRVRKSMQHYIQRCSNVEAAQ
jgi:hypothetical protein